MMMQNTFKIHFKKNPKIKKAIINDLLIINFNNFILFLF